ncbi:MAG: hypothetical protein IPP71_08360 [Bacteroidetes bacterium]|nr:hypothetical protein [Bacteroidota bacterium]
MANTGCTFDTFVVDNEFNRIIKYVITFSIMYQQMMIIRRYLREILFILDEVSDRKGSCGAMRKISFNPIFCCI